MQKILSLSEHEAQELQNSSTGFLDGFTFFPINSQTREILNLFHKPKIGDTDTFKLIFFAFWKNMLPPTGITQPRFPNEFSKHSELFIPSLRKSIYGITSIFPNHNNSI